MHDVARAAIFTIVKWLGKLRLPTISEPFHNGKDSSAWRACGLFTSTSRWQRNRDPVYWPVYVHVYLCIYVYHVCMMYATTSKFHVLATSLSLSYLFCHKLLTVIIQCGKLNYRNYLTCSISGHGNHQKSAST